MADLYAQWDNFSQNLGNTPFAKSPTVSDLGSASVQPVYDPNCDSTQATCPQGTDPTIEPALPIIPSPTPSKKANTTTIIVAVIVVVVVVAAVVALAIILKCAYEKHIWCFEPDNKGGRRNRKDSTTATEMSIATQTTSVDSSRHVSAANKSRSETFDYGGAQQSKDITSSGKATVDLVLVEDEESASLPTGWAKFKHRDDDTIMYINELEMISQRYPPGGVSDKKGKWF